MIINMTVKNKKTMTQRCTTTIDLNRITKVKRATINKKATKRRSLHEFNINSLNIND